MGEMAGGQKELHTSHTKTPKTAINWLVGWATIDVVGAWARLASCGPTGAPRPSCTLAAAGKGRERLQIGYWQVEGALVTGSCRPGWKVQRLQIGQGYLKSITQLIKS